MSTVGTIEVIASINTSGYKSGAKKIDSINKGIENDTDSTTSKNSKSWLKQGAVMGAVAGVASAVFSKAMSAISDSVGDAVKRVDTLNNFPKIMTNLGYSAGEAKTELGKLEKGVLGLPTSLDQIALSMQRLTPSSKSMSYATDLALAMNNAILSGGSSMDSQRAATEQLTQAFSRGKFELEEFKSLQVAMPAQLAQVAKFLGITSGNTQELDAKLQDGTISMDTFKDAMITMSKEGGAGFASFETQAKDATSGIGTTFTNMQTTITRGLSKIIEAIGTDNINSVISGVGSAFEFIAKKIESFIGFLSEHKETIKAVASAIGDFVSKVAGFVGDKLMAFFQFLKDNKDAIKGTILGAVDGLKQLSEALKIDSFENFKNLLQDVKEKLEPVKDILEKVGNFLKDVFLPPIKSLVEGLLPQMKTYLRTLAENFRQIWGAIKPILPLLAVLAAIFLGPILLAVYAFLWALKLVFPIMNFILTIFNYVLAAIAFGFRLVMTVVSWVFGVIKDAAVAAFNWIWDKVVWVKDAIVGAFNWVKVIVVGAFNWVKDSVIQSFQWIWDKVVWVKDSIVGAFNWTKDRIVGAFNWVKEKVMGVFDGIVGFFGGLGERMLRGLGNIADVLKAPFKAAFNGIAKLWNNTVGKLSFSAPDWVPGIGVKGFSMPKLPELAKGGLVMPRPGGTIAKIAEAGEAEAVIPLSKLDAIISGGGGSGSGGSKITQYNTIYTELDMNVVNRKLTWELGRA